MASVTLVGVRKIYQEGPGARLAVDGVDLAVLDGEFVVLVGPSGCGKSTTLRMIAGLESITAGTVRIGERGRSEEHTSELQSRLHIVCRLLLEKKKKKTESMMSCVTTCM